jgi:hypothetical protein
MTTADEKVLTSYGLAARRDDSIHAVDREMGLGDD